MIYIPQKEDETAVSELGFPHSSIEEYIGEKQFHNLDGAVYIPHSDSKDTRNTLVPNQPCFRGEHLTVTTSLEYFNFR